MIWAGRVASAAALVLLAVPMTSGFLHLLPAATSDATVEETTVKLAPLVASWGESYAVAGTKAEPLYTERISASRDGDVFAVRIEMLAQGDAAGGVQESAVRVTDEGTIQWLTGCTKTTAECESDDTLRGYLSAATLVSLARTDRLPETGIARAFHERTVVCVDDAALHPDAAPAIVPLETCFDAETGAAIAQWSAASAAFVAATVADGVRVSDAPDSSLLSELVD